jgi:hypothetical protein
VPRYKPQLSIQHFVKYRSGALMPDLLSTVR